MRSSLIMLTCLTLIACNSGNRASGSGGDVRSLGGVNALVDNRGRVEMPTGLGNYTGIRGRAFDNILANDQKIVIVTEQAVSTSLDDGQTFSHENFPSSSLEADPYRSIAKKLNSETLINSDGSSVYSRGINGKIHTLSNGRNVFDGWTYDSVCYQKSKDSDVYIWARGDLKNSIEVKLDYPKNTQALIRKGLVAQRIGPDGLYTYDQGQQVWNFEARSWPSAFKASANYNGNHYELPSGEFLIYVSSTDKWMQVSSDFNTWTEATIPGDPGGIVTLAGKQYFRFLDRKSLSSRWGLFSFIDSSKQWQLAYWGADFAIHKNQVYAIEHSERERYYDEVSDSNLFIYSSPFTEPSEIKRPISFSLAYSRTFAVNSLGHILSATRDGLIYSTDGGTTAKVISTENQDYLYMLTLPDGTFVVAPYTYETPRQVLQVTASGMKSLDNFDSSPIMDMVNGDDGLVYILAESGISKFDGQKFTKINFPDNQVIQPQKLIVRHGTFFVFYGRKLIQISANGTYISSDLPKAQVFDAIDMKGQGIYISAYDSNSELEIYRSLDEGKTWTNIPHGLLLLTVDLNPRFYSLHGELYISSKFISLTKVSGTQLQSPCSTPDNPTTQTYICENIIGRPLDFQGHVLYLADDYRKNYGQLYLKDLR